MQTSLGAVIKSLKFRIKNKYPDKKDQTHYIPKSITPPLLEDTETISKDDLLNEVENRLVTLSAEEIENTVLQIKSKNFLKRRFSIDVLKYEGQIVKCSVQLMWPLDATQGEVEFGLVPVLWIPGGFGVSRPESVVHMGKTTRAVICAVDWICRGKSTHISGLDPAPSGDNAILFKGDNWTTSYQLINLCAFIQSVRFLLSHNGVDKDNLICAGTSWGGFYTWLLASICEQIKYMRCHLLVVAS